MRVCPSCGEPREGSEFRRLITSPGGNSVTLDTRECVRCIAAEAKDFHKNRKARQRRGL